MAAAEVAAAQAAGVAAEARRRQRSSSAAAAEVAETSRVVTFHFDRVTQIEKTYGVAPTLTKSGAYLLRNAYGVGILTGGECARLHGYPPRVVAAYEAAASSGQLVAAVGDGFVIGVVRDVLKAALKTRASAEAAGAAKAGSGGEA